MTSACGFNKSGVVYPEYLASTGWLSVQASLQEPDFNSYANAIRSEVTNSRVAFVKENALQEAMYAAPIQLDASTECESIQGIAVLVHGLSDSAFSMRDMANELSKKCFIARTVLLPGHGTKPGDLLNIRLSDWTATIQYLVEQASEEHDNVVAVGFSLGAVLLMTEALKPDSNIDAIITLSPAFYLTTSPWAELTKYIKPFKTWLDKEKPDDTYRYEAIPTNAVVETVRAKSRFHKQLSSAANVSVPWLLVQSDDDLVIETAKNESLFLTSAKNVASRSLTFYGESAYSVVQGAQERDERLIALVAHNQKHQVSGLTHVAIHQSPDNHHYGVHGNYRNCGSGGPRPRSSVSACENAVMPWLGPWNGAAPDGGPYGMSTYNPYFDALSHHVSEFLANAQMQ